MVSAILCLAIAVTAQDLTQEKINAMGSHMLRDMQKRTTPVVDPTILQFVARVAQRLEIPERSITTVQTREFREPTALPGGFIVVPATVFQVAQDEDEFACLLAHVFAHSELKHSIRSRASDGPVIMFMGLNGIHVDTANRHTNLFPASLLGNLRTAELEADAWAIERVQRAGYDPAAFRRYVARLQPAEVGKFDALPERDARLAAMDSRLTALPAAPSPAPRDDAGFRVIQAAVLQEPEPQVPTLRRK